MPAYVAEAEAMQEDEGNDANTPPEGPDLFDYAAEAEDYEEDMLDREFWSRGMW